MRMQHVNALCNLQHEVKMQHVDVVYNLQHVVKMQHVKIVGDQCLLISTLQSFLNEVHVISTLQSSQ